MYTRCLSVLSGYLYCCLSLLAAEPLLHSYQLTVQRRIPHDPSVFTQGLTVLNGVLYESGGGYGHSSIRRYPMLSTTTFAQPEVLLPPQYFAEGLTHYNDELFQLTWREQTAFRYTPQLLSSGSFTYHGDGWGLCNAAIGFVTSDGSATLTVRSYSTFMPQHTLTVRQNGKPVKSLNALAFRRHPVNHKGYVYANVWGEQYFIEIDIQTGLVTAQINAAKLVAENFTARIQSQENVLNGIAYNEQKDTFFVTGKRWDWLYEIKLSEISD